MYAYMYILRLVYVLHVNLFGLTFKSADLQDQLITFLQRPLELCLLQNFTQTSTHHKEPEKMQRCYFGISVNENTDKT